MIRVLSLGWGVQSWTLAAMAALGEMDPLDAAIHADTGFERAATYQFARAWSGWLQERGVRVIVARDPEAGSPIGGRGEVHLPAYTRGANSDGQIKRQCTGYWKVRPIKRAIRALLRDRGLRPTPGAAESWMGISIDEFERARTSDVAYIAHRYPLLELGLSRADCLAWLARHGLPAPPKSACTFCPYQSLRSWRALKAASGIEWDQAVAVDELIRDQRPRAQLFVHPARVPLVEAVRIPEDHGYHQMQLGSCDGGFCFL